MLTFVTNNLDYLFFSYFIGFLTLLTTSFLLKRLQPNNKFWFFLGSASTAYMLSLVVVVFRYWYGYKVFYLTILEVLFVSATFLLFIEYSRQVALSRYKINIKQKWVVIFFLVLVGIGLLIDGIDGANVYVRMVLGLISCCWFSFSIISTNPIERQLCSRVTALVIVVFGVLQFVTSIYSLKETIAVKSYFIGFIAIMLMNLVLWRWFRKLASDQSSIGKKIYSSLVVFVLVLVAGWFFVDNYGKREAKNLEFSLLSRARTATAAVNPERVKKLVEKDIQNIKDADYVRLKEQLAHVLRENKDTRFLYIVKQDKQGEVRFIVDAEPEASKDYAAPGSKWNSPPKSLLSVFAENKEKLFGPYTDEWGVWMSSFVPINDFKTGELLGILGLDISFSNWTRDVSKKRLDAIAVCLIFFILMLSLSTLHYVTKLSESTLKRSEEKFAKAFENNPMLVAVTKLENGEVIDVNKTFLKVLGFNKKDVIGKTVFDLNIYKKPSDREKLVRAIKEYGFVEGLELVAQSSKGEEIIGLMYAAVVDIAGELCLINTIEDITQKIIDERIIKQKTEELENFFNVSINMLCITSDTGKFVKVSSACRHILGYEPQDLEGKNFIDFIHPEDVEPTLSASAELNSGSAIKSFINRYKRKDGSYVWIEWDSSPQEGGIVYSSARDVTQTKLLTDELRDQELYLRTIWNSMQAGVALIDAENHTIVDMNNAGLSIVEASRDQIIGASCKKATCSPGCPDCPILDRGEKVENKETSIKNFKGKIIPVIKTAELIKIKNKEYIIENFIDISKIKETKDLLIESEKRFKTIVENIPGTTYRCLLDKDWTMTFLSSDVEQLTGYHVGDFINNAVRSYSSIIYPEDNDYVNKLISEAINGSNDWELEYRIIHKDGTIRWVYEKGKAVRDDSGKIEHLDGIIMDITERKKVQNEIRKLSLAIEQSPATVVLTDLDGNIEYVNPTFSKLTGYTAQEAKGQNPRILKSGELQPEAYKELWDTIKAGKEWKGEFHNKRKDGSLFWESASIAPVKNDKGELISFLAVKEDITKRKEIELQLKKTQEALVKTMKVKDEFLSVTSHDLKSPLGIVKTSMSLLLEEPGVSEHVKEYANMSLRQANRGLKLIMDLLNLKKLEDGNVKLELKKFNVSAMVKEVLDDLKVNIDQNHVSVEFIKDKEYEVTADYSRLVQVLSNLVDNALKYTPKNGKLNILASVNSGWLKLGVRDFGQGISNDKLSIIFEKYEQTGDAVDKKKGHGIGLAIAKMICDLHGGRIWAESKEGEGSTFYFEIPNANVCDIKKQGSKDICSSMNPSEKTVLIVDDLADERKVAGDILKKEGFNIEEAGGWESALQLIRNAKIDAVVLDIEMPEINGLELLEIIRREKTKEQLPVLLYSSRFNDIEDCHKYGANDYAHKNTAGKDVLLTKVKHLLKMV